jgi:5-formyltetrahydrofolate cyclo-ligase
MAGSPGCHSKGVMETALQKQVFRKEARLRLKGISPEYRRLAAVRVCARIQEDSRWQSAQRVLLYWPLPDELDLRDLLRSAIASGKQTALPRYCADTACYAAVTPPEDLLRMAPGQFGILEPLEDGPILPLNQLDFAIIPGVAFDLGGHRLGRGKGFYDRLLANVRGVKCGVCLDEQVHPALPAAPHDVKLNCLATPSRWLEFGSAAVLK